MAVAHRLPNGYVVLLMTPREATLTRDQLLDPNEFPWTGSEAQMVGMEVRDILTKAVAEDASIRLSQAAHEMMRVMESWTCPECQSTNPPQNTGCDNCGFERQEAQAEQVEQLWRCNECGKHNPAKRKRCVRCAAIRSS